MRLFARICACFLLAGNVSSLTLNTIQASEASQNETALRRARTLPNQTSTRLRMGPLLSRLRGSNNTEEHFSARMHIQGEIHAATSRTITLMSAFSTTRLSLTRIMAVGFMVLITLVSLFVVCSSVEDSSLFAPPDSKMPPKQRQELLALVDCEGTWAQTYRESDDQSKQGLELLFRCHIIPTVEFAHSKVSQEHVGECVWISTHMLRQRPLEEWLDLWPEAQRTFEENVTACYVARIELRSSSKEGGGEGMETASPRTLQRYIESGGTDPSAGSDARASLSMSEEAAGRRNESCPGATPDLPPILKTPADRKSLMERCRQIMAKSDSQRRWDSGSRPGTERQLTPPGQPSYATPPTTNAGSKPKETAVRQAA